MPQGIWIFLILGLIFRMIMASFAYKGHIYDAGYYDLMAKEIASGNLVADCCGKNMGYPALLAIIYILFGANNLIALISLQIILDLSVAVILFVLAQELLSEQAAWMVFTLYIFNPITSSYTGMGLSEIPTIFLVTLAALIISRRSFKTNIFLWVFLGATLGLLLFTRLQFYFFVFLFMALLALLFFKGIRRLLFLFVTLVSFTIFSSYTLIANVKNFHVISLLPPYNITIAQLYLNFFDEKQPELISEYTYSGRKWDIQTEYFRASAHPETEVKKLNQHYGQLFREKIRHDWPEFVLNTFKNTLWLWDKRNLYTYYDLFYPWDFWVIRTMNIFMIFFFLGGVVLYAKRKGKKVAENPIFLYSVFLFVYITGIFSLLSNESRHTVVFYPLLLFWAAYGILEGLGILNRLRPSIKIKAFQ